VKDLRATEQSIRTLAPWKQAGIKLLRMRAGLNSGIMMAGGFLPGVNGTRSGKLIDIQKKREPTLPFLS
jgi:hypothetical protein